VVKGTAGRSLDVVTSLLNSCSYSFTVGHRYVVYARRVGALLVTSECSGTHALTAGESPFALRRVPVYLTAGSRLGRVIATTRPGEYPGRGALRLLLGWGTRTAPSSRPRSLAERACCATRPGEAPFA
jgi:hypothetical protein